MHVVKRDGETVQPFNGYKIRLAASKALAAAGERGDLNAVYQFVLDKLSELNPHERPFPVEEIQDVVEEALMACGYYEAAKKFVLYRSERAKLREKRPRAVDPAAISEYIHRAKYARYIPEWRRRETFEETVERVMAMHLQKFALRSDLDRPADIESGIREAFQFVREKRVLPSMRTMQFAGSPIFRDNSRAYNCSFTLVDRPRVFAEAFHLLLCGTGVGFSVQLDHVERLPEVRAIDEKEVYHCEIDDSIEGWADALNTLVEAYYGTGEYVEFNYSQIRPEGAPIQTSGGKAPGHIYLKRSLEQIRAIFDGAIGRKLKPIECYDIFCHFADAVLSGGVRRSAMIALFSYEDGEMMNAKTGKWYDKYPWRSNSNNSVVLKRDEVREKQFKRIVKICREWGEPGFVFSDNYDWGVNPCAEIGLDPVLVTTIKHPNGLVEYRRETGWAFCNLCEINGAKLKSKEDFVAAARAAAIIGTLQASYTHFPYLGRVSEEIAKRDALLGIGITGMMDSPAIAMNAECQLAAVAAAIETNKAWAAILGIQPAARVTCVKPSGTTSLFLGCTGSGIHPHHARRYIRRITANENEPVFQFFKSVNPHMCVRKPDGDWVIELPVEAPADAITKGELPAVEFLKKVLATQSNWVAPGTRREPYQLRHNVSNTCCVGPDEWDDVANFVWAHRFTFTAVTLIARTNDKDYQFAPNEEIKTETDEARWHELVSNYVPVDYTKMFEDGDATSFTAEPACANGKCELVR